MLVVVSVPMIRLYKVLIPSSRMYSSFARWENAESMVMMLRPYNSKKRWAARGGRILFSPRPGSQVSSVSYPMASWLCDECQVLLDATVPLVLESVSCSVLARA